MPRWEYKNVVRPGSEPLDEAALNAMGANAYELAQVVVVTEHVIVVGRQEERITLHYIFKRPASQVAASTAGSAPKMTATPSAGPQTPRPSA